MKLCRICLSQEGRLYSMSKYGLDSQFKLLTGMNVDVEAMLPQWVCAECGLRLLSYNKLRQKSLRAHQLLCDMLSRFNLTDIEDLTWSIDHKETRLTKTEIVINHYDPNEEDLGFLTYDVPIQPAEIKREDIEVNLDTKQDANDQAHSQNDVDLETFYKQDDYTSNDEEIALSCLVKSQKLHKTKEKTQNNDSKYKKRTKSDKQREKEVKSSQKHRVNKSTNHRQKQQATSKQKQENKRKRIKEKEDDLFNKETNHRLTESEIDHKLNEIETESLKRTTKKEDGQAVDGRLKKFPFESMFTVTNMSTEELKAEVLKRKMSSNYLNAAYQCTDCFKGFCDEETYDRHRLRHSQDWGSVICDICKNHYPCKRSLARHFSRMHSLRYTCRNCSFVASSRGSALRHGLKHMGKKYQCKHCEMEYVNYTTYLNHLRKSHASEFVCELCGLSFVSALGVRHHKRIIHRLDPDNMIMEGPQCTTCDIRFASEEAYAKHFKFSAKHVIKAYDVKQKRLNQGIKQPTFCEQCDLKLDSQLAYFAHFKSAHPGVKRTRVRYSYSFMCELCGRIFKSNIALEEHRRIHRKEKPFVCQQCGRAFTQKIALKMHAAIHDENRTLYPCHLCEKRFTNRNNLKRHVFLHSGARPFECESCGKTFKTKSEKHTHYEYVHLKKPWPKRDRHRRVIGGASATVILQ